MNFGIAALIVVGAWALLSVVVSVTVGRVAGFRDGPPADLRLLASEPLADVDADRERLAS